MNFWIPGGYAYIRPKLTIPYLKSTSGFDKKKEEREGVFF